MWTAGQVVVQEEYFAGHVITARPVTVVRDEPKLVVLYTAAGSTQIDGTMRNRSQLPIEERMRVYASDEPQPLAERQSRWHVLTLNEPGAHHSFWVFWTRGWDHFGWYVNFQTPYQRTEHAFRLGFGDASRGMGLLDLFVTPDLKWSWKDLDEFEAAYEHGMLTDHERQATLNEADRMIERIEGRGWPFNEPWPDWRPDPGWSLPHLRLTGPAAWQLSGTPSH